MMKPLLYYISTVILLATAVSVGAQERRDSIIIARTDSVSINFRQSKWDLDPAVGTNAAALDSIDRRLSTVLNDSVYRLRRVRVFGGASPEGSVEFNKFLSEQRAATLFRWFDEHNPINLAPDKEFTFFGRDWQGVLRLARQDHKLPYRDETLALLTDIVTEKERLGAEPPRSLQRLKALRGGEPYRYLYRNVFPSVRASKVVVDYDRILSPEIAKKRADSIAMIPDTLYIDRIVHITDTIYFDGCPKKPFYMDIRTNMILDVLAVPNIGVEFYLGKNWTIGANYMHAWWRNDPRHRYWRLYGGEINTRRWFGKAADEKPLTGHHAGVYVQALTYDFEWGNKGYIGGLPGGSIFDLAHFGAGVEYGYSLPVARRLNIDFTIGVGYIGGRVYELIPYEDLYLWTATKHRSWFGPTKLEISLAWLIGRGNVNKKKGGSK